MTNNHARIIEVLTKAFDTNKSVNFIVKQDRQRVRRMERLMEYSIWMAEQFGKIVVTDDENACMLLVDPKKKKTTLKSLLWQLKLVFQVIGVFRLRKVLKRERSVNHEKTVEDYVYLWFVGVDPMVQGTGNGTKLIQGLIADPWRKQRPIYLETSNPKNFPLYERLGFECTGTIQSEGYAMRQYVYQDPQ